LPAVSSSQELLDELDTQFEPRLAKLTENPRTDALYLYGTDRMGTQDIFEYFVEYSPGYVEWLNLSSCVIGFADEFTARRALNGLASLIPLEIVQNLFSFQNEFELSSSVVQSSTVGKASENNLSSEVPVSVPSVNANSVSKDAELASISNVNETFQSNEIVSWYRGKDWKGRCLLIRSATMEDIRATKATILTRLWRKRTRKGIHLQQQLPRKKRSFSFNGQTASVEIRENSTEKREGQMRKRQRRGIGRALNSNPLLEKALSATAKSDTSENTKKARERSRFQSERFSESTTMITARNGEEIEEEEEEGNEEVEIDIDDGNEEAKLKISMESNDHSIME